MPLCLHLLRLRLARPSQVTGPLHAASVYHFHEGFPWAPVEWRERAPTIDPCGVAAEVA